VIHIGYHKTGTSWLQKHFFSNKDLNVYLIPRKSKVLSELIKTHPFDFKPASILEKLRPEFEKCQIEAKIPVISKERLSGNPHSGGYDSKEIANRLYDCFPEARIIIVIREQREMILSCYKTYIKKGGLCKLKDYINPKYDDRRPQFRLENFKYDRLIGYYQNLFGTRNVLVIPYELFRSEPEIFIKRITDFCKIELCTELPFGRFVNPSSNAFSIELKRRINLFITRDSLNGYSPYAITGLKGLSNRILGLTNRMAPKMLYKRKESDHKEYIKSKTSGHYNESNRITSELIGIDLSIYGYEI
jgi:hypothetical protein